MKRIIIAFDGSYYSESALEYAVHIAKSYNSQLVGLFIEDMSVIEETFFLPRPPFSGAVPDFQIIEELKEENQDILQNNINRFLSHCEKENELDFVLFEDSGVAVEELLTESKFADLILIGYVSYFSNVSYIGEHNLVTDLLKDAHCPVLATPEHYQDVENIIFTYDGKASSIFAIKQFCYLFPELLNNSQVHLLSVIKEAGKLVKDEQKMQEYLTLNYPDLNAVDLSGEPIEEILHFAETVPGPLVVTGSFERRPFFDFLHKSVGEGIVKSKAVPAFITHK